MVYPDTFKGFAVYDTKEWNKPKPYEFKPKPFTDDDIDIEIECCGVCGSDVHTVTGGWGKIHAPIIVGHEIIGKVVRAGPKVTRMAVGDRVGVGAQVWACLECDVCKAGNEVYCPDLVDTYNGLYADGTVSQGGYASHVRVHQYFAFKIPENLDSIHAAPLLCAGITTYSPLYRNGAGPGKKVAIVGIGGLGHFAIMWAKALGAETYAISRTDSKKADALKLGADHFIETQHKGWEKEYRMKFDLIVCCANSSENFDLGAYLSTLNVGAKFVSVGLPEGSFEVNAFRFIANGCFYGSSHLGSREEMEDMLKLASEKNLVAWTDPIPISAEGCGQALVNSVSGKARYRYTLSDFASAFGDMYPKESSSN